MLGGCLSFQKPRAARVCAMVTGCALFGLAVPAIGRAAGPYVSLGDSYTSAPLVLVPTGNPIGCGRSTNNYPSDVARVMFCAVSRIAEIPADLPKAVVCAGGLRSSTAISAMKHAGVQNWFNVTGGMTAWQKAGYHVEAGGK